MKISIKAISMGTLACGIVSVDASYPLEYTPSPTQPNSRHASYTAMDMLEDDMVLFKDLANRAYDDTNYSRNPKAKSLHMIDLIGGIEWSKYPFHSADGSTGSLGTVYYNESIPALVVAFTGTIGWKDLWTDAQVWQRPAKDLHEAINGYVHTGFSNRVIDLSVDMKRAIRDALGRELRPDDDVYFVGHSLGGALSMLTGVKTSYEVNSEANRVKIITFSTPRGVIGDSDFVNQASQRLAPENIVSFGTYGDVVPYLPQKLVSFALSYEEIGTHIEILPTEKVNKDNITKGYFTTFHSTATDEVIKESFRYTQWKYRITSLPAEEVGKVSFWSLKRNSTLKFIYGFCI